MPCSRGPFSKDNYIKKTSGTLDKVEETTFTNWKRRLSIECLLNLKYATIQALINLKFID